ncbi:MAG: HD domain-containing protein [Proteobacteria bacterium]|nr:HD domain-containing protein [Pseudomonadota bacterium]MBU1688517.1 HD domain-containing protein [Pseudomonadota bacterium]
MEVELGGQHGKTALFWEAFSYSVHAHQDQKRKSGEAYVSHPCEVTRILVRELGVRDPGTLAAAVLHDTVEDVPEVTTEVIGEMFGREVEAIVDGVTKIANFEGDRQTFYKLVHRKLFTGAAARVEVLLIKLADRLHNLRTMASMPKHKQQKIADETLDVYAPMAGVVGLYSLKRELYDLALRYRFPRQAHKVENLIAQLEQDEATHAIIEELREDVRAAWLNAEISIRVKGLWAYFDPVNKLLNKEIETPLEILIEVDDIPSCYRLLGLVNQRFPPIPRTIRDFIANPKPTGYQCLHVRAIIRGQKYLFKIRTHEMINDGRSGIIKEWSAGGKVSSSFENGIKELLDILGSDEGVSYRDMIAVSGKKEIYTYTPKGDSVCLPANSTVLDFAFKVHTEVGRRCLYGMAGDRKLSPGDPLYDGNRVKIITQKEPVDFEPAILELCQTARARSELSKMFRLRHRALAREIGRSIIRQELKRYGIPIEVLVLEEMEYVCETYQVADVDTLFQQVGKGNLNLKEVVQSIRTHLYEDKEILAPPTGALNLIYLETLDPAAIKFSRCCHPVPVEKGLIGLLSARGLSVHRKDCDRIQELKMQREDVVELRWRLKETRMEKEQTLLFLKVPNRNRFLMMLGVAPEEMRIQEVILLSHRQAAQSAWEVKFMVDTLLGLRNILNHFKKAGIEYDYALDQ